MMKEAYAQSIKCEEPCEGRLSRTVLWEGEGETPSLYSTYSGKPFLFDPESGCYANDETIAAIEESMSEEGEVFTDFDSFMQSLDLKPISCTSKS